MRIYLNNRKYKYITLDSDNFSDAKEESINRYLKLANDIDQGNPIGNDRKKLGTYIKIFMDHMEIRRKNGYCTQHRVVCVRQLLVSLKNFAKYKNNPDIKTLAAAY